MGKDLKSVENQNQFIERQFSSGNSWYSSPKEFSNHFVDHNVKSKKAIVVYSCCLATSIAVVSSSNPSNIAIKIDKNQSIDSSVILPTSDEHFEIGQSESLNSSFTLEHNNNLLDLSVSSHSSHKELPYILSLNSKSKDESALGISEEILSPRSVKKSLALYDEKENLGYCDLNNVSIVLSDKDNHGQVDKRKEDQLNESMDSHIHNVNNKITVSLIEEYPNIIEEVDEAIEEESIDFSFVQEESEKSKIDESLLHQEPKKLLSESPKFNNSGNNLLIDEEILSFDQSPLGDQQVVFHLNEVKRAALDVLLIDQEGQQPQLEIKQGDQKIFEKSDEQWFLNKCQRFLSQNAQEDLVKKFFEESKDVELQFGEVKSEQDQKTQEIKKNIQEFRLMYKGLNKTLNGNISWLRNLFSDLIKQIEIIQKQKELILQKQKQLNDEKYFLNQCQIFLSQNINDEKYFLNQCQIFLSENEEQDLVKDSVKKFFEQEQHGQHQFGKVQSAQEQKIQEIKKRIADWVVHDNSIKIKSNENSGSLFDQLSALINEIEIIQKQKELIQQKKDKEMDFEKYYKQIEELRKQRDDLSKEKYLEKLHAILNSIETEIEKEGVDYQDKHYLDIVNILKQELEYKNNHQNQFNQDESEDAIYQYAIEDQSYEDQIGDPSYQYAIEDSIHQRRLELEILQRQLVLRQEIAELESYQRYLAEMEEFELKSYEKHLAEIAEMELKSYDLLFDGEISTLKEESYQRHLAEIAEYKNKYQSQFNQYEIGKPIYYQRYLENIEALKSEIYQSQLAKTAEFKSYQRYLVEMEEFELESYRKHLTEMAEMELDSYGKYLAKIAEMEFENYGRHLFFDIEISKFKEESYQSHLAEIKKLALEIFERHLAEIAEYKNNHQSQFNQYEMGQTIYYQRYLANIAVLKSEIHQIRLKQMLELKSKSDQNHLAKIAEFKLTSYRSHLNLQKEIARLEMDPIDMAEEELEQIKYNIQNFERDGRLNYQSQFKKILEYIYGQYEKQYKQYEEKNQLSEDKIKHKEKIQRSIIAALRYNEIAINKREIEERYLIDGTKIKYSYSIRSNGSYGIIYSSVSAARHSSRRNNSTIKNSTINNSIIYNPSSIEIINLWCINLIKALRYHKYGDEPLDFQDFTLEKFKHNLDMLTFTKNKGEVKPRPTLIEEIRNIFFNYDKFKDQLTTEEIEKVKIIAENYIRVCQKTPRENQQLYEHRRVSDIQKISNKFNIIHSETIRMEEFFNNVLLNTNSAIIRIEEVFNNSLFDKANNIVADLISKEGDLEDQVHINPQERQENLNVIQDDVMVQNEFIANDNHDTDLQIHNDQNDEVVNVHGSQVGQDMIHNIDHNQNQHQSLSSNNQN